MECVSGSTLRSLRHQNATRSTIPRGEMRRLEKPVRCNWLSKEATNASTADEVRCQSSFPTPQPPTTYSASEGTMNTTAKTRNAFSEHGNSAAMAKAREGYKSYLLTRLCYSHFRPLRYPYHSFSTGDRPLYLRHFSIANGGRAKRGPRSSTFSHRGLDGEVGTEVYGQGSACGRQWILILI
jgi:hypothetical protein